MSDEAYFDQYAGDYDKLMQRSLALAGEDKSYFARKRILYLQRRLKSLGYAPESIMDYGCGTGTAIPLLKEILNPVKMAGVDVSPKSLDIARTKFSQYADFKLVDELPADGSIDLIYVSSVFHHIMPPDRPAAFEYVLKSLRPGGIFAFWEHNPWNPGTLYAMSQCAFDDNAVTISPVQARSLLAKSGFKLLRSDFLFIFPRVLALFRPLELYFSRLPLGAQYQVLCQRPLE